MSKANRLKRQGLDGKIARLDDIKKKENGEIAAVELVSKKELYAGLDVLAFVTNNVIISESKE